MDRLIVVRDLAQTMAIAGARRVRDGATVTSIELEIAALSVSIPAGAAIWAMRLRYPAAPRIGWLAGGGAQRRRAGVDVARLSLRWVPSHLDALVDGHPVARLNLTHQEKSSMSLPPKTPRPKSPTTPGATPLIACTPIHLPADLLIPSAKIARQENPRNHPISINHLKTLDPSFQITSEHIAVLTTKFWRIKGLKLTVSFLDTPPAELRTKILSHMNAWGDTADVAFVETASGGQVRVARTIGDGHWSYLGTDILLADKAKPTMNLDGFTMATPDSEFFRVVRHETGHTLGCPHEHMRADLIADIDREKAITYYMASQGWTRDQVIQQVLTPISEGSLWGTGKSDVNSIMCYQIPANLTLDGVTIPGGTDIDASDRAFIAQVYPKGAGAVAAPPAAVSADTIAPPPATPVAQSDTVAAPVPAAAPKTAHVHGPEHRDCVEVDLAGGVRLNVHPGATSDQIKRVVEALRV